LHGYLITKQLFENPLELTYSYPKHCKPHIFTLRDIWRSPSCITLAEPCRSTYRIHSNYFRPPPD